MHPVNIYSLDRNFSEEEIATIFAKCARSPEPFNEIAKKVTVEGAAQFHEKYVINYGHASVAEMAVPNICFEGVSILASKILESMPRGAYQEKSTRAQNFLFKDEDGRYTAYYIPPYLEGKARDHYIASMEELFATYERLKEPMQEFAQKVTGSDKFVAQRRAFDALRYLLPIGTQTNLAMRMNGRDLSILITKLLSSEVHEFRELGRTLKEKGMEQLPTLVRHADSSYYIGAARALGRKHLSDWYDHNVADAPVKENGVELAYTMNEPDAIQTVARSIVCQHGFGSFYEYAIGMEQATHLINEMLEKRGEHDPVPEELAAVPTIWDIVVDYGAYRDLQRHRRCKQFPQLPTTELGFSIPDDIVEAGFRDQFEEVMENAAKAIYTMREIAPEKDAFLYMTPLAYRHRTVWYSNLEQDFYVIELRSKPQGHISYRNIACGMYDWLKKVYPTFAQHIRCVKVG